MNDVDRIYSASIKWLAYTPLASMTVEEKKIIVRDMLYWLFTFITRSKCALLSQEVYSFGEILTPEIREVAAMGGYTWLYSLLMIVNKGEVAKWNEAKEPVQIADAGGRELPGQDGRGEREGGAVGAAGAGVSSPHDRTRSELHGDCELLPDPEGYGKSVREVLTGRLSTS